MPAIPAIALAFSVIGAGVSAYSAVQSGESQKDAANYNATVDRQRAQDALQRGAIEAAGKRDKARQIASSQVEAMSSSGISTNTGTALDLLTETAGLGKLDAMRSMNNARREAWGLKASADLDVFEGKAAKRTGYLNAAGTLLSSAGSSGSSFYGMKKAA
jgi:hypothetical protein